MSPRPRNRHEHDQALSEADQTAADTDQTPADADQTAADADQSASDRDQAAAEADQRASNLDQAASDRELAAHSPSNALWQRTYQASRAERGDGTLARQTTGLVREQGSSERDEQARQRDEDARQRDRIADQRDRAADQEDREAEGTEELLAPANPASRAALDAAAAARARGAGDRARAAVNRARAARDGEEAANDREELQAELRRSNLDELTGAYRRGMGEIVLRHEIERAGRSTGELVLAFVDVDGLKSTNDRQGHAAGDALLRDVVTALRSRLRPYDLIARWGGDEFICTISDTSLDAARDRLEEARAALAQMQPGASISVGLAGLRPDDTFEALIGRADRALLEARPGP